MLKKMPILLFLMIFVSSASAMTLNQKKVIKNNKYLLNYCDNSKSLIYKMLWIFSQVDFEDDFEVFDSNPKLMGLSIPKKFFVEMSEEYGTYISVCDNETQEYKGVFVKGYTSKEFLICDLMYLLSNCERLAKQLNQKDSKKNCSVEEGLKKILIELINLAAHIGGVVPEISESMLLENLKDILDKTLNNSIIEFLFFQLASGHEKCINKILNFINEFWDNRDFEEYFNSLNFLELNRYFKSQLEKANLECQSCFSLKKSGFYGKLFYNLTLGLIGNDDEVEVKPEMFSLEKRQRLFKKKSSPKESLNKRVNDILKNSKKLRSKFIEEKRKIFCYK